MGVPRTMMIIFLGSAASKTVFFQTGVQGPTGGPKEVLEGPWKCLEKKLKKVKKNVQIILLIFIYYYYLQYIITLYII